MTPLPLTPDELLTTTRSVRRRLDLERAVERSVIEECLELALQAPTGSNSQGWQWVFVTDPEKRRFIADRYNDVFRPYVADVLPTMRAMADEDVRSRRGDAILSSAVHLSDVLHEVPVLMIPCYAGRVDGADAATQAGFWGSLLPAVWSFMLALRSRGLGSSWTTLHLVKEREVAEHLGIPYAEVTQGGLFPIAYTKGTDFKRAARVAGSSVAHWDTW